MDGWMDAWMDGWMDAWMDGWMDLYICTTHEYTDELTATLNPKP